MTEQTIPADKVRELIEAYEGGETNYLIDDLRALLPAPPQPTTGVFGRWAKHPKHGDVVVISNRTDNEGDVWVSHIADTAPDGANGKLVSMSDLTFPEQATKPEEVPAGEAWLVELLGGGGEQRAFKTAKNEWQVSYSNPPVAYDLSDGDIILISPLTPERPGKDDLQAKYDELDKSWCYLDTKYSALRKDYDELDAKYAEAQEKIKALEQPSPAWRIEHEWWNLRVGEYMVDYEDYGGTVTHISPADRRPCTDGLVGCTPQHSPWIVFPNVDAVTVEAIKEAKRALDKEMGE